MRAAAGVSAALVEGVLAGVGDLDAAAACLAAGQTRALVAALVAARRAVGDDPDLAITAVMRALERLMDQRAVVGAPLMAHFYPVAGARKHHHVCDAIELWMDAIDDPAVAAALRSMRVTDARAGLRASMQRRCLAWAAAIEARAAPR